MTIRGYTLFFLFGTLTSWLCWFFVLSTIDPFASPWFGKILFYVSLGAALLGTSVMIGFFIRRVAQKDELVARILGISLRQAFWITVAVIISLALLHGQLLRWWNILILIITLTFLELLCLSLRRRPALYLTRDYKENMNNFPSKL